MMLDDFRARYNSLFLKSKIAEYRAQNPTVSETMSDIDVQIAMGFSFNDPETIKEFIFFCIKMEFAREIEIREKAMVDSFKLFNDDIVANLSDEEIKKMISLSPFARRIILQEKKKEFMAILDKELRDLIKEKNTDEVLLSDPNTPSALKSELYTDITNENRNIYTRQLEQQFVKEFDEEITL